MNPYQDGHAASRFVDTLEELGAFADAGGGPAVR